MASIFIRCMLFFCSYFPLILIICVLQYGLWPWWVIALLGGVLGLGSLLITWGYFSWVRRTDAGTRKILKAFSRHDSDVMAYISSYIVPFVTFALSTPRQIITLLIFVFVLLIIYVHSNMVYINPMLNLVGYHLYEIEVEQSQNPHYYIARQALERGHAICFVQLSRDIYLEK